MNDKQLHYRCSFSIKPKVAQESNIFWADTLKLIRGWIVEKINEFNGSQDYFIDSWYFSGGRWQCNNVSHIRIETFRIDGETNLDNPKFWALRFEHADKTFAHRTWVTDFVIESIDTGCLNITLSLFHYIHVGYIGKEPELPIPTSPKIIRYFLSRYNCYAGDTLLCEQPITLKHGKVRDLWNTIISPHRYCPIIVVRSSYSGQYPIDPYKLATLLKGTAVVYQVDEQDYEEETKHYLGKHFWNYNFPKEHIRIYFPNVNLNYHKDFVRHRFFTPDRLKDFEDKQEVTEIIVRAISRRFKIDVYGYVQTIEEVQQKQREQRLAELKRGSNLDEYVNLLEFSNEELTAEMNLLKAKYKNEEEKAEYSLLEIQDLQSEIEKVKREAEFNTKTAYSELTKVIKQKDDYEDKLLQLNSLTQLPKTLKNVVDILSKLHSDKLVFHENALQSAFNYNYDDTDTAWQVLWHTATTLWDIYFLENTNDIAGSFKNKSGFDLALSEGSLTKENKDLMEHRRIEYNGSIVDITPHIKADRRGKNLRIYYYVDSINEKIIIGHCGSHLPTHGTRVRKEG